MRKLNLAMLSEEVAPEVEAPVEVPEVVDAQIEVQADADDVGAAETTELALELDEINAQIDEGAETAEVMTEVADKVAEAEEQGGLDPIAAEAIKIAMDFIGKRAGVKSSPKVSLEGFQSKASRVRATSIAVEDWKDQVEKIKQMLINAWTAAKEWFKKLWARLVTRGESLKQKGEELAKAAAAKKDETAAADASLDLGSSAAYLVVGKGEVSGGEVVKGFKEHAKLVAQIAALAKVDNVVEYAKAATGKLVDTAGFDTAVANIKWPKASGGKAKQDGVAEGWEKTASATLLGGKALATVVPASGVDAAKLAAGLKGAGASIIDSEEGAEATNADKVAPLTAAQAEELGTAVAEHYGKYVQFKKDADEAEKVLDELIKSVKEIKLGNNEAQEKAVAENKGKLMAVAQAISKMATSTQGALWSHDDRVGSAAVSYGFKSLKVLGAKPEGEAAAT